MIVRCYVDDYSRSCRVKIPLPLRLVTIVPHSLHLIFNGEIIYKSRLIACYIFISSFVRYINEYYVSLNLNNFKYERNILFYKVDIKNLFKR